MTVHDTVIKVIAQKVGGEDNHHHPRYHLMGAWGEGSFTPDIVEYNDSGRACAIHEVEVAKTKMTKEYLDELEKALKWNVQAPGHKHRPFTTLWIVLENYKQMARVFDRVEILTAPPTELNKEILKQLQRTQEEVKG